MEYIEREDEFDIHPIEEIHKRRLDLEDETIETLPLESAKTEIEEERFSMPVLLDVGDSESEEEIVAVGPGTMRRKSPGEGREWMNGVESGESGEERGTVKRSSTNGAVRSQPRVRKR